MTSNGRDPNLDYLRALAVAYVLLGHIMIATNITHLWIFTPEIG